MEGWVAHGTIMTFPFGPSSIPLLCLFPFCWIGDTWTAELVRVFLGDQAI
jgi:hypothetical protein